MAKTKAANSSENIKEKSFTDDDVIRPIRWKKKDYQAIENYCTDRGEKKISTFIKELVLTTIGRKTKRKINKISPIRRDYINQLNKIGVNVNQFQRSINKGIYPANQEVIKVLDEVKTLIKSEINRNQSHVGDH